MFLPFLFSCLKKIWNGSLDRFAQYEGKIIIIPTVLSQNDQFFHIFFFIYVTKKKIEILYLNLGLFAIETLVCLHFILHFISLQTCHCEEMVF